jgi:hypothetical protein
MFTTTDQVDIVGSPYNIEKMAIDLFVLLVALLTPSLVSTFSLVSQKCRHVRLEAVSPDQEPTYPASYSAPPKTRRQDDAERAQRIQQLEADYWAALSPIEREAETKIMTGLANLKVSK